MKKYEEYQDSGVDWMGEIPAHWKAKRNKFCFSYKKGKIPLSTTDIAGDNTPVYLAMDYLRGNPKQIFYVDKLEGATIVNEGDMLLLWDGSNAGEFVPARAGVLSSTMAHLSTNSNIENKFAWYFLKAFEPQLKSSTIGMGIPHVDGEELMNGSFVVPPLPEQRAIAAYLDRKTAQLDTLLAQKEALLQMLHQKRQALINEAVTQGLDPAAPRKPSGVAWLGDVPAHWEVKRLKNICSVRQGLQIPIEMRYTEPFEGAFEYITIRSINNPGAPKEYIKSPSPRVICDYDDILMARTGATAEVVKGVKGAFHNNFFLVDYDRKQVRKDFLYYYLSNSTVKEYLKLMAGTTTIPDLNHGEFYATAFPHPPLEEQECIERYIKIKSQRFDAVNSVLTKQIKTLKAYRQSLISEVVTGKVDVRTVEAVAPKADLPLWRR